MRKQLRTRPEQSQNLGDSDAIIRELKREIAEIKAQIGVKTVLLNGRDFTIQSNFTEDSDRPVRIFIYNDGSAYLQGRVTAGGGAGTTILTVPAPYRPTYIASDIMHVSSPVATVDVNQRFCRINIGGPVVVSSAYAATTDEMSLECFWIWRE